MSTLECLVNKTALHQTQLRTREDAPLADGQVRIGIDHFALTANNVTYAAFGDAMGYWQFYPTGEDDWGLVPVWGFGRVLQSAHPGVAVGERLYGFFPMASQTVLQPEQLSDERFTDGAAHRAALPAVYNQYLRVGRDPLYTAESEDLQALLRPLYTTSWLIDDFLGDQDFFGAGADGPATVLLSSASSKTAYGTAVQLAQRGNVQVIGLTSSANRAFCESLGCYSRVLSYEELDQIDAQTPCVYVDFAGNGALRQAIHSRFAHLRYSMVIGNTHVDQRAEAGAAKALPGPRATFFFAPAQIKKRVGEWGAADFNQRMASAWHRFAAQVSDPAQPWLEVQHHTGGAQAQAVWLAALQGRSDPRAGHMISLHATSP